MTDAGTAGAAGIAVAGLYETGRRGRLVDTHVVRAVGQADELVTAEGVGGRGGNGIGAAARRAGAEVDCHVGQAGLTRVLGAVAVAVIPDAIADAARVVDAEVETGVFHAGIDRQVDDGWCGRLGQTGRNVWVGRVVGDRVGAWRDDEEVLAVGVGGGREGYRVTAKVDTGERYRHVGQHRLTRIEHAVVVDVVEHRAFDRRRLDEAKVDSGHILAQGQGYRDRCRCRANHGVDQARRRAGNLLLGNLHDVVARRQVVEEVVASAVGDVGGYHRLADIGDAVVVRVLDQDQGGVWCTARTAGTVGLVLQAVTVGVVPDEVTDRAVGQHGMCLVAVGQRDRAALVAHLGGVHNLGHRGRVVHRHLVGERRGGQYAGRGGLDEAARATTARGCRAEGQAARGCAGCHGTGVGELNLPIGCDGLWP